jgi:hypothetical protein
MKKTIKRIFDFVTIALSGGWTGYGEYRKSHAFSLIILCTIILFTITQFIPSSKALAAGKTGKWSARATGVVVDVDPIACNGQAGLFFEINGSKGNKWLWLWNDDMTKPWPERGSVGTFYTRKVDGDDKYKWVYAIDKSKAKNTSKKTLPAQTIKTATLTWSSVIAGLPPIDKTVLVKYKNGKTITTAYLNSKKQWKLETDRERVASGREITTIAKWRDIQD